MRRVAIADISEAMQMAMRGEQVEVTCANENVKMIVGDGPAIFIDDFDIEEFFDV